MANASHATSATNSNHIRIDFAPSADEVARKVYFKYGDQDSRPEEVLQHWLEAEAQLLAEGNATRVYGLPNRPQLPMSRATRPK